MIIGVVLGISISIFIVSTVFFLYGIITTGIEQSTLTAAVIGTEGIVSYSLLGIVFSLIAIIFCIMNLKKKSY
jgi:hypothetical protein